MVLIGKLLLSFDEDIGKRWVKMLTYIKNMTMQKHLTKGGLESDKLSNEEKQKLIKIKKGLNIIELKKSVETALNDVLQYVRKP